jgi:hypothetical protein
VAHKKEVSEKEQGDDNHREAYERAPQEAEGAVETLGFFHSGGL